MQSASLILWCIEGPKNEDFCPIMWAAPRKWTRSPLMPRNRVYSCWKFEKEGYRQGPLLNPPWWISLILRFFTHWRSILCIRHHVLLVESEGRFRLQRGFCKFAIECRKIRIFPLNRPSDPCGGQYWTKKETGEDRTMMHFVKCRPSVSQKSQS